MAQAWKVIIHTRVCKNPKIPKPDQTRIHTHKNAPTEIHKLLLKTNKLSLEDFW